MSGYIYYYCGALVVVVVKEGGIIIIIGQTFLALGASMDLSPPPFL
jgi:hypothetical protein